MFYQRSIMIIVASDEGQPHKRNWNENKKVEKSGWHNRNYV